MNSLFFADDGLLLAEGVEEAKKSVRVLKEVAARYRLEMNERRSSSLLYNIRERVGDIEGVGVVNEIKYLGVTVEDKPEIFDKHRRKMIEKAKRMSNLTYSVIEKSCHKVKVGKIYWKSVVLPSVLFGMEVIDLREKDIGCLQR